MKTLSRRSRPRVEPLEDRTVPSELIPSALFDPSFNGNGTQIVPFQVGGVSVQAFPESTAVEADNGKIVAAGVTSGQLALTRLNPDGTLDTTFATNGTTNSISLPPNYIQVFVAIQPGDKIIVAYTAGSSSAEEFAVRRFNVDGSVDTSFGTSGLALVAIPDRDNAEVRALAIDASGKILIGGRALNNSSAFPNTTEVFAAARLNADGSPDSSFGSAGTAIISFDPSDSADLTGIGIQPSTGRIILSGTENAGTDSSLETHAQWAVAGLSSNGTIDTSFGDAGKLVFSFNAFDSATALAIGTDGKILLAGSAGSQSLIIMTTSTTLTITDIAVARLNADGSFDNTFFSNTGLPGRREFELPGVDSTTTILGNLGMPVVLHYHTDYAQAAAIEPNGDIIIEGFHQGYFNDENFAPTLLRLHADGTLAAIGVVSLPGQGQFAGGLALQADGKIVLTGDDDRNSILGFIIARLAGVVSGTQTAGVFDPNAAVWYLHNANASGASSPAPFQYGAQGWVGVIGDWAGTGPETIGVFDPVNAVWYLRDSNSPGTPHITPFQYGAEEWIPLVGDWKGSGHSGIGVFDPATATWYLRSELDAGPPDGAADPQVTSFQYGAQGWIPVVGDWTGTGHLGIGVFDPTNAIWYLRSSLSSGPPDVGVFQYGAAGWKPVVGDWTRSGHTGIGLFDPTTATWYLRSEANAGAPDVSGGPFQYGAAGWEPVVGDYLGPVLPQSDFSGAAPAMAGSLSGVHSAANALPAGIPAFSENNQPVLTAGPTSASAVAQLPALTLARLSLTAGSQIVSTELNARLSPFVLHELARPGRSNPDIDALMGGL